MSKISHEQASSTMSAAANESIRPIGPSGRPSGLWLDRPDAMQLLRDKARNDVMLQRVGQELIEEGFCVLPGMQDTALIDQAVKDYYAFLDEHREMSAQNKDESGRQFRLVNFHAYSDAAMQLAKNTEVMRVLDFLFGSEAAVHTSLTFQYSTMQALHRDSPYFHSFPEGLFFGVWTAFEDIHPNSGPLSYIPKSHRIPIDQWQIYNDELAQGLSKEEALANALRIYQTAITDLGEQFSPRSYGLLKKGDVAIWHPQLIHGGSPAIQPELKRHSMVVHCCPAGGQIFVEEAFFTHQETTAPSPYYSFTESYGRQHGDFRTAGFMTSI